MSKLSVKRKSFISAINGYSLRLSIPLLNTQWAEEVYPYIELVTLGVIRVIPPTFQSLELAYRTEEDRTAVSPEVDW